MRICSWLVLSLSSLGQSFATPVSFEERDPARFVAHFGDDVGDIRPDRFCIDGVTFRFVHAGPNARLEGVGAAAPSTYIRGGATRTFGQFPKVAIRNLYAGVDAVF